MNHKLLSLSANDPSLRHTFRFVESFGSQLLITFCANVALILLGLVTGVLLARLLGPDGRGELAAIQLWPSFIAGFALLGLPDALAYFSAQSPNRAGRFLGSSVALGVLLSVPFMGLGYVAMPLLLSAQPAEVVHTARWCLLLVPLTAAVGTPYQVLRGRGDFFGWNVLRLAPGLGWLAVICLAWLFGRPEPNVMALGYLLALVLNGLLIFYTVKRRIPGPFSPDPQQWQPLLRYGLPAVFGSVPQVLNLRLDQMLMAALLPPQVLGLYVVAVTWSGAIAPALNALGAASFPKIASQSDPERQAQTFSQVSRMAVFSAGLIGLMLMLFTPLVFPFLFGERFAAVIPTTLVLVLAAVVAGINLVLEEGLRGLGKPGAVALAELGGLAVTIVSLFFLLRPLQTMGAALASILGYGAITVLLVLQIRELTGNSLSSFLRPTQEDLSQAWHQSQALIAGMTAGWK